MKKKNKKKKEDKVDEKNLVLPAEEAGRFRDWLEDALPRLLKLVLIDFVKIELEFCGDRQAREENLPEGVVFVVHHSRMYHRATISVFPEAAKMWLNKDYDELIASLVHELAHMNTGHLAALAMDRFVGEQEVKESVESLTETIANYILRDKVRLDEIKKHLTPNK